LTGTGSGTFGAGSTTFGAGSCTLAGTTGSAFFGYSYGYDV